MMKDFDVVVVGAGLGGLSAAANLARSGKSVLLLEKHNVPGGYASSFLRGRFEFDASLHELSGVGGGENKGPLWGLLNEYGVTDKVEFVPIPDFYRCVLPDMDITLPVGRRDYEDVLCDRFPDQARGIRRFTSIIFDMAGEALQANLLNGVLSRDLSPFPTLETYLSSTMAEVFHPLVTDPKARAVVGQLCHYLGQPPSKLAFLPYAMAAMSYLAFGPVHVKGTSQALSQAFVDVIEENGGQVRLNNGAARVLVSEGKIRGVTAEDGTLVVSPYVICNVNPLITCLRLIGREHVPAWYLKRLGAWTPGLSTFNVFLGLDCPASELGLEVHETFVATDYDLDRQYELARTNLDVDLPGGAVTAYNAADPDFSPPGTSVVVVTLAAYGRPWLELAPPEYQAAKDLLTERSVELVERIAPGLRRHIEVLEAATPLTNFRYSGAPGGSFTGFAENRMPTGMGPMPGRGPIEGLHFANAWVRIGGGYMPCILAGFMASNEVMADMEQGGPPPVGVLRDQVEKQTTNAEEVRDEVVSSPGYIIEALHPRRLSLRVDRVIAETPSTRTLRLTPTDGRRVIFRAGQYINLFVRINGTTTSRPYSISSPPGRPYLDITVRRKKDGFVSPYLLDDVKPGDVLESTGPGGAFYHDAIVDSSDLVFLAGGSGITPFASIIRETAGNGRSLSIHLLYGSRVPEDIIFKDELKALADRHENFKVDFVISEPPAGWPGTSGFLDRNLIQSSLGTVEGKTFFICGPAQMYDLCIEALRELNVPARCIKKESHGPPENVSSTPGWPDLSPNEKFTVVEERSGKVFDALAGEPLMISLERAGLVVPAFCRSGECAACRTRLVSGEVFIPPSVHRRRSDVKAGFIHPCMSYPLEDLRIRL